MVVKMIRQDINLIENDYYEKGENYQTIINENVGADSLINFQFVVTNKQTKLLIKNISNNDVLKANLSLIYLANKAKDKNMEVQLQDTLTTQIDLSGLEKGNWLSQFNWNDKDGKHYLEKNFFIK